MDQTITMVADTTAAHGCVFLTATFRALETQDCPDDDRREAQYHAGVVLDTDGNLQLVWRQNGDWSALGEDGDGLPVLIICAWLDELVRWGHTAQGEGAPNADSVWGMVEYLEHVRDVAEAIAAAGA